MNIPFHKPRAIAGRVFGNSDPAAMIAQIKAAVVDMKSNYDKRFGEIEETFNESAVQFAALGLNGGGGSSTLPVDREYTGHFASYARRGAGDAEAALKAANGEGERAAIHAAMSVGDNSSGGYLAPVEWDRQLHRVQRALSPIRRIAKVVTSGRAAYSTLWSDDLWGSGWVGETAVRPATQTASLQPLIFPAGEIYAMPAATQRLLDDGAINVEEWLAENLGDEFSRQEGIAFVSGDGVNKPMGFLRYATGDIAAAAHPGGAVALTPSGASDKIAGPDQLIDMKYALGAPYRQNATWVMNSSTAAIIAKMKDGQGNYIWREGLIADEPARLLGRPVEIDENMPSIAGGAIPVAFGDFARGYLVNDRVATRILRDPYSNKPFVLFYATKRVGGGLLDPKAIRLLKIAVS